MARFGLIKSFQIDNGELDGLRLKDCFTLGYELAMIDHMLTGGQPISQPVHVENRERIEASCRDDGRPFKLAWMPGDESESWLLLEVPGRD